MAVDARFWFATGVEVYRNIKVPEPPPHIFRILIQEPLWAVWREEPTPLTMPSPQIADFRLSDWGKGGEVAHYELDSQPRKGWRWLAVDGQIRAEKIK